MALEDRTSETSRPANRSEPRLTVREYWTPTSGYDVSYLSWAMWRYCRQFPEDVVLIDQAETIHKSIGRQDGTPLGSE